MGSEQPESATANSPDPSAADALPATPEVAGDAHSALVATTAGRIVVAALMLIAAVWIALPNLPASMTRDRLDTVWTPADRLGVIQDWAVFSPNPRSQSLDVQARVEFADGDTTLWEVPEFDPFVGAYRQYRWKKWQERVRLDARRDLWDPAAEWLAGELARDGERPVRITLIRRWIDHQPLTDEGVDDGDWNEFEFHVWEPDR